MSEEKRLYMFSQARGFCTKTSAIFSYNPVTNGTPCSQQQSFVSKVIFWWGFSWASSDEFVLFNVSTAYSVKSFRNICWHIFPRICEFLAGYLRDLLRHANLYAAISVGRLWCENFCLTTASLSGGGCPGCPGASTLAQPAPRQSYAPMAGKPAPSSHELPRQWNEAPVTLI